MHAIRSLGHDSISGILPLDLRMALSSPSWVKVPHRLRIRFETAAPSLSKAKAAIHSPKKITYDQAIVSRRGGGWEGSEKLLCKDFTALERF